MVTISASEPDRRSKARPGPGFASTGLACCILFLTVFPARAVLFFSTGDPAYNTTAPAGRLTNSGWQFQGAWGGFSGTTISPNCFITAKHVGGAIGDPFVFQGLSYQTVAYYDSPDSDLRIWRVSGQFPVYATLYTKRNERGRSLIVIGRGTRRGAEVRLNNKLRGWEWGEGDGVQRWGQSHVREVGDGGDGLGELLRAPFAPGGRNQAHLSTGDSGGAVFIKDGKFFKLAGINYAVDGPYNTSDSGSGFAAALYNQAGFYAQNGEGVWTLISRRKPGAFYATRISSHIDWINAVLSGP